MRRESILLQLGMMVENPQPQVINTPHPHHQTREMIDYRHIILWRNGDDQMTRDKKSFPPTHHQSNHIRHSCFFMKMSYHKTSVWVWILTISQNAVLRYTGNFVSYKYLLCSLNSYRYNDVMHRCVTLSNVYRIFHAFRCQNKRQKLVENLTTVIKPIRTQGPKWTEAAWLSKT